MSALDTPNTTLKDQIFQLLSALTLYSDDGLKATIQALDTCKVRLLIQYVFNICTLALVSYSISVLWAIYKQKNLVQSFVVSIYSPLSIVFFIFIHSWFISKEYYPPRCWHSELYCWKHILYSLTPQVRRKQRYRFSLLINELRNHGDNHQYMVTIVGFVNCLIEAHDDLDARNAIRNEFIGNCLSRKCQTTRTHLGSSVCLHVSLSSCSCIIYDTTGACVRACLCMECASVRLCVFVCRVTPPDVRPGISVVIHTNVMRLIIERLEHLGYPGQAARHGRWSAGQPAEPVLWRKGTRWPAAGVRPTGRHRHH